MENLNFKGWEQNAILDKLIEHTNWLADQYKAAIDALPSSVIVAAIQSGDVLQTFFINSSSQHLPVMAASAEAMKVRPPVIIPPLGPTEEE